MVTRRAGVIGHPISQSLSPKLHGRWIDRYGIDARFDAIDGDDDETFARFLRGMEADGFAGVNITIPFKRLAFETVDKLSKTAKEVGAVNLVTCRAGELFGDNTDVVGFAEALRSMGLPEGAHRARVIGAGGAAPAIVVALQSAGFSKIELTNRTASKADNLAARFDLETVDWADRGHALGGLDLLVNATSLGMTGQPPLEVDPQDLPGHAGVIDIVTTPRETPLLSGAREKGLKALNGLPMLVHQAIPSFEAWFGVRPDDPDEALAFLESST